MPRKRNLRSQSALTNASWPLSDDQTLALMLDTAHRRFLSDRTNSLPAFHAMACVGSYVWGKNESPPPECVSVPYWALEVIAEGFKRYTDGSTAGMTVSFGQVMQIEGGGQGKPPRIIQYLKELRDIRIAQRIAFAKEAGIKVEAAIQDVADAHKLDHRTVRDIWSRLARRASRQLQLLRAASERLGLAGQCQHRTVTTRRRRSRKKTS